MAPDTSRLLALRYSAKQAHFVASPVFGRPPAAVAKKLLLIHSGLGPDLFSRVQPLFDGILYGVFG